MGKKFTYYYGPLAAPLKAKVEEGTSKGQCAAGEGRCDEHPTKAQWKAKQSALNVSSLYMDIVDEAEENAVTLEEYNDPDFSPYATGWTLEIKLMDKHNGDLLETVVHKDLRSRKDAEAILLNFPFDRDTTVPEGVLTNAAGNLFFSDPYNYMKRYDAFEVFQRSRKEKQDVESESSNESNND